MTATHSFRAWEVQKTGSLENLSLSEKKSNPLEPGLIRVATRCVGLNFADVFVILGIYSATPKGIFTPGLEFSGTVTEIHPSAQTNLKVGDFVMGVTRFGSYSEQIDVFPECLYPLPKSWNFEQGAACMVQALTAWYSLVSLGNLKKNQTVLIHSAAGGVGLYAMAFAKKMGAHPIGTVSSQKKVEHLNSLGYSEVFIRTPNFYNDLITMLNGRRLDLVLESVGGKIQKQSYQALSPMGRLVIFGAGEFAPRGNRLNWAKTALQYLKRPLFDPLKMTTDNKSVMAFNLIWLWEHRPLMRQLVEDMMNFGVDTPTIDHCFSFEEAVPAVQHLKSGTTIGKVVLKTQTSH